MDNQDNTNPTIQPNGLSQVVNFHIHNGVDSPRIPISSIVGYANSSRSIVNSFNGRTGVVTLSSSDVTVALGFTPENVANKSTNTSLGASDTLYPSQNAVKTYVDNHSSGTSSFTAGMDIASGRAVYMSSDSKMYPTDSTSASYTTTYLGITSASVNKGSSGTVFIDGIATSLSGLITGTVYYLKDAIESIDQTQTNLHGGGGGDIANAGTYVTRWQSVAPTGTNITKLIARFGVGATPNTTTLSFSIYNGTGTGGTLLGTINQTINWSASPQSVTVVFTDPIQVSSPFTIAIAYVSGYGSGLGSQVTWLDDDQTSYPSGTTDQGGTISYYFTEYTKTGLGLLNTSAGSVSKKVGVGTSSTNLILKDAL